MSASDGTGSDGGPGGGRGMWIGAVLVVVAVVVVVVAGSRGSDQVPFDVGSSAPDGYKALAMLLRDRGARIDSTTPASLVESGSTAAVVVVADPDLLSAAEHRALMDRAASGALVVLGAPRRIDASMNAQADSSAGFGSVPARVLADTPARPSAQGSCDIARLGGLGAIDTAFAEPIEAAAIPGDARRCYGDIRGAFVAESPHGAGSVVTLASPYLWSNARLQPSKEDGGEPLDNAAMALRLLGPSVNAGNVDGVDIDFVDAVATGGVAPDGSQSPLELMPTGVKLALAQLVAAFVLYAWWRGRRLAPVVTEKMPVEIAGSELIVAVGDLLRRRGTPQRAADVLRSDARRELCRRLGVPLDAPPSALVAVVAARCDLDPEHVATVLSDGPIGDSEALVRLADALSDIRQEVLDHHVVR